VAHSWAPPYKRGADFGRSGRQGGLCARSPRARALGLLCGRDEGCTPEGPGVCRIEAPKRKLGDCDVAHSWAPPYKRGADFGRNGRRGGLCARSPRARALGLLCGREERCTPEGPGVCRIEAPKRQLGDCDVAHSWAPPYKRSADFGRSGRQGGLCARSPRARARGFYAGETAGEGVARVIEPASQVSGGRMPERSLRGVSGGRMPERTSDEMARATPTHPGGNVNWQTGLPVLSSRPRK